MGACLIKAGSEALKICEPPPITIIFKVMPHSSFVRDKHTMLNPAGSGLRLKLVLVVADRVRLHPHRRIPGSRRKAESHRGHAPLRPGAGNDGGGSSGGFDTSSHYSGTTDISHLAIDLFWL